MLKTLVKKQLMEIFRSYFYNAKTNKKRSTAGIIAYILLFAALMIGGIGGMFTGLSVSLCAPLTQAGMGWLYFALMSLLAIFLGAFGSVFSTYSSLYLSIPPSTRGPHRPTAMSANIPPRRPTISSA